MVIFSKAEPWEGENEKLSRKDGNKAARSTSNRTQKRAERYARRYQENIRSNRSREGKASPSIRLEKPYYLE